MNSLAFAAMLVLTTFSSAAFSADPPAPGQMRDLGLFRPSYYWVALETNDGQPKTEDLLDLDGNRMVTVSKKFHAELRMEGTGRLLDGRLINFKARVPKPDGSMEVRWRWCGPEAPYGYGFEDYILLPFRSAAVDPTVVPLGSKLYIPAARGARLPDGTVHDGYFHAIDIGSAITDRKIDLFTAYGNQAAVFERHGMETGKMTHVYLVK